MSIITRTFKTKLKETGTSKDDPQHVVTINMDFTDIDGDLILEWAAKDRAIVFQNGHARKMTVSKYMSLNGKTISINELCPGRKPARKITIEDHINAIDALQGSERKAAIAMLMSKVHGHEDKDKDD